MDAARRAFRANRDWLFSSVGAERVWSEIIQRPIEMTRNEAARAPDMFFSGEWNREVIRHAGFALAFRLVPPFYLAYVLFVLSVWSRDFQAGRAC